MGLPWGTGAVENPQGVFKNLIDLHRCDTLEQLAEELDIPCEAMLNALARYNELCAQGYRLKVFDAYRPACAVKHFQLWGMEDLDLRMKQFFYPEIEKQDLFKKGYIAARSSHTRGSTVDLTLLDMQTGKEVDMGGPFDFFGERSHPDFKGVTDEQYQNRMFLQNAMSRNGFVPLDCEWWHFTLKDEPYPDTYFDFPVSSAYLRKE